MALAEPPPAARPLADLYSAVIKPTQSIQPSTGYENHQLPVSSGAPAAYDTAVAHILPLATATLRSERANSQFPPEPLYDATWHDTTALSEVENPHMYDITEEMLEQMIESQTTVNSSDYADVNRSSKVVFGSASFLQATLTRNATLRKPASTELAHARATPLIPSQGSPAHVPSSAVNDANLDAQSNSFGFQDAAQLNTVELYDTVDKPKRGPTTR